jgi:hypothetical protein
MQAALPMRPIVKIPDVRGAQQGEPVLQFLQFLNRENVVRHG